MQKNHGWSADPAKGPLVAIVSEAFARRYWNVETAVGKRIRHSADNAPWITVTGVVKDEKHYGLDQGPVALMIENYRSGFLWRLMRECPAIVTGLRRAGFRKGWLRSSHR